MPATFEQPELIFTRVEEDDSRIEELVRLLTGRDWTKARQILEIKFAQNGDTNWHDRLIRDLAAESGGRIAGGQRGYKLTSALTEEEMFHAVNWMRSQAEKMNTRATEIQRAWFGAQALAGGHHTDTEKTEPQMEPDGR